MTTVRGEMSKKKKKKSLNTEEALILGNPPPPSSPPSPLDDDDDDHHHHLFSPSLSSSLSSTDRFDPIKNYSSISSLEIDSKNHSHQPMEEEEEEEQRGRMEEEDRMEVKSYCSVVVKLRRSAIKEKRRSSVQKKKERNQKEMMCPSLHSTKSTESTSVVPKDEQRKSSFGTPQSKRLDCRDREFELMPPLGSHKKSVPATSDVDQPIDPNEPTYCVCHQIMTTVRGEMSKKKMKSLNTEEALILGNPPPPSSPPSPLDDDDDDHHHLFNPSLSSSLSSTDRFDPIKNYPSISSLETDSKNHSHQPMEEEEEEQRGRMEEEDRMEVKSSCSVVVKLRRSAIKEKRRSSVQKTKERNNKEMMCSSLHSTESTESTSVVPKDEKRNSSFGTPQSKRLDCRDREFELMPPPGSVPATSDVDQPIDPNEPTYCVCHQVSHGDMIACYMDNCQGGEWFHYSCVGLTPETRFKGNWYCPTCKLLPLL